MSRIISNKYVKGSGLTLPEQQEGQKMWRGFDWRVFRLKSIPNIGTNVINIE